jgi:hypothetical protein
MNTAFDYMIHAINNFPIMYYYIIYWEKLLNRERAIILDINKFHWYIVTQTKHTSFLVSNEREYQTITVYMWFDTSDCGFTLYNYINILILFCFDCLHTALLNRQASILLVLCMNKILISLDIIIITRLIGCPTTAYVSTSHPKFTISSQP